MYHYTESGLRNIWLENGYATVKTKHGKGVSIRDVEGLHRVIGKALAQKPKLTGAELRFLRKEMEMSQGALAMLVGTSEQSVSLWERRGNIPKTADRLVRLIYLEHIGNNPKVMELIDRLNLQDRKQLLEKMTFSEQAGRWREAA
jgi:DNA-binding transcriptional regulator YiaG